MKAHANANTIKDILLLHHSHTDIGYTNYQDTVFALQRDHIRRAMMLAERYAENAPGEQFKWTCETTIIVEDFLKQASEAEIERLQKLHQQGLIGFGGMYCNVTPLFTTEMLIRSLSVAEQLRTDYGFDIRYALNSDVNGQSWGLVEMLLDAGFEGLAMAINRAMAPDPQPRPSGFWWQGPSGRYLLTWHGEHYGDGNNLGIPRVPTPTAGKRFWHYDPERAYQPVQDYVQQLAAKGYTQDFAFLQIIGSYMWDNDGPDEYLPRFVKEWNARGWQPRMRIVTLAELFARIDTNEVRVGDWTDYWAQGINSSAFETALARQSHSRFFAVQQLGALLQHMPEPMTYPTIVDEAIWQNLALYDEHTWGSSESISHADSVQSRGQWHRKATYVYDAAESITRLQQVVMRELAARVPIPDEPHAVVYNTLPWERKVPLYLPPVPRSGWELARLERDLETGSPQGSTGQRFDYGVVTLPAGGYVTVPLQITEPEPISRDPQTPMFTSYSLKQTTKVQSHGWLLQNDFYALKVDPLSGAIYSLVSASIEWVDTSTPWRIGHYVYETIRAVGQRSDIQLPPFDTDYDYRPHLAPQYHGPECVLEKRFEAGIDSGRLIMRLQAPGVHDLFVQIVLYDDLPWIDLIYDINKRAVTDAESVYIAFPVAIDNPIARYEVAGAIVEAEKQQILNACRDYYAVQNWIDVSNTKQGMTLASPDAPLFHIGGFNNHRHQTHLHVEQPLLVGWPMNNHWWTNFKRDQRGWVRVRYRILLHHASFDPVAATRFGMETAVEPLIGPLVDREPGIEHRTATAPVHLTDTRSLVSISPHNVSLVTFRSIDGKTVLRLQEIAGEETNYTISILGRETVHGKIEPYRLQELVL